jgi:hypothetical protein
VGEVVRVASVALEEEEVNHSVNQLAVAGDLD